MYLAGRIATPRHRGILFAAGLLLFFLGALCNAWLFNAVGVLIFVGCLLLSKPLLDLAYNPIELSVVDAVSREEGRSPYAYLFNHELGLFPGRLAGCGLFLAIAHWFSAHAALRYALPVVALAQLISIPVANQLSRSLETHGGVLPPCQEIRL